MIPQTRGQRLVAAFHELKWRILAMYGVLLVLFALDCGYAVYLSKQTQVLANGAIVDSSVAALCSRLAVMPEQGRTVHFGQVVEVVGTAHGSCKGFYPSMLVRYIDPTTKREAVGIIATELLGKRPWQEMLFPGLSSWVIGASWFGLAAIWARAQRNRGGYDS